MFACDCSQRSREEKNISKHGAPAFTSLLVLLKGVLRQDEVVDEVLILRHKQLRLDYILGQLHLQIGYSKMFHSGCFHSNDHLQNLVPRVRPNDRREPFAGPVRADGQWGRNLGGTDDKMVPNI